MDNQFEVIETFINEAGQEKGSVSGDMALQALGMIRDAVQKCDCRTSVGGTIEDYMARIDKMPLTVEKDYLRNG